jgi:hypothetical protein
MSRGLSMRDVAQAAGVSPLVARTHLADYNPMRALGGHHRFDDGELPQILAFIKSKCQANQKSK